MNATHLLSKVTTMTVKLLPTQYDFVFETKYEESLCLGGYGAGKTFAAACKALYLATLNAGYEGAILSPTHSMLMGTFIVVFEDLLIEQGINYTYRASPNPSFVLHFEDGSSKIHCRSGENYKRLASLNLAWAVVDEADKMSKNTTVSMWKMLQSRLRVGNVRHLAMSTTPEGYSGAYQLFVLDDQPFRTIFRIKTTNNHHLPDGYVERMYVSYTAQEIEAYVNGEFTNLKSGTVYYSFDRTESHANRTVESFHTENTRPNLFIGMDFNTQRTCGMVCVVKDDNVYVVDEFVNCRDTDQLIEQIAQRYINYKVFAYPDSSGKSSNTVTTLTDIALLKAAFGDLNVKYRNKNPRILARVRSVNTMFCNSKNIRRLFVNTHKCPTLTTCLEQQAWSDTTGLPEKKHDVDHPLDALGYFIHYSFGIERRPTIRNI